MTSPPKPSPASPALLPVSLPPATPASPPTARASPKTVASSSTLGDSLVAADTDERQDVYEWEPEGLGNCQESSSYYSEATGACLALISAGTGASDSRLLSAGAGGTDVYLFTRDSLAPQDQNGPVVKVYDAREGGGFPYLFPPEECKASDECHGAASPAPGPIEAGSEASTPDIGNAPKEPETKLCKKGFVKKHGKLSMPKSRRCAMNTTRASTEPRSQKWSVNP